MPQPRRQTPAAERKRKPRSEAAAALASKPPEPPEEDDRWWVLIVATVADLGAGRYGVWKNRPKGEIVPDSDHLLMIKGEDDEPVLFVNLPDTLSVAIGQYQHFDAHPPIPEGAEIHDAS